MRSRQWPLVLVEVSVCAQSLSGVHKNSLGHWCLHPKESSLNFRLPLAKIIVGAARPPPPAQPSPTHTHSNPNCVPIRHSLHALQNKNYKTSHSRTMDDNCFPNTSLQMVAYGRPTGCKNNSGWRCRWVGGSGGLRHQ